MKISEAAVVKDLQTIEGFVENAIIAGNVVLAATATMSWSHGAAYATIAGAFKATRLGLTKLVAAQKAVGVDAPKPAATVVGGVDLSKLLADVAAAEEAGVDPIAAPAPAAVVLPESGATPDPEVPVQA